MIILVVNCGSSSLKYQVLDFKSDEVCDLLAKGLVERIGIDDGCLTHKPCGKDPFIVKQYISDHTEGMKLFLNALTDKTHGVLASLEDI